MGLLETARPILGYVIAIALILLFTTHQIVANLLLSGIGFMSSVSIALVSSAAAMAQILIIVALLIGVAAASKASKDA